MSYTPSTPSAELSEVEQSQNNEVRPAARAFHWTVFVLWVLGFCVLVVSSVLTYHHGPWPGEVEFSRAVQSIPFPVWIQDVFHFITTFNDPLEAAIAVPVAVLFLVLIRWYRQALFLVLTVGFGNGFDVIVGDLVNRSRPTAHYVHVYKVLTFNSFPSGHTEHMMVFYGFLLYLSFSYLARTWKYHWLLIPFQLFALFSILIMGFARIWEGEHWLSDVLAGYLDGTLWLVAFIALYRWTTHLGTGKIKERFKGNPHGRKNKKRKDEMKAVM